MAAAVVVVLVCASTGHELQRLWNETHETTIEIEHRAQDLASPLRLRLESNRHDKACSNIT